MLLILGGGFGTLLRYFVGLAIPFTVSEFAWATFMVNMAGCFAIGTCYPWFHDPMVRTFLVAGVLGGFTTFSGFGLELLRYMENHSYRLGTIYGIASVILGTVLVWLGYKVGMMIK